MSDRGTGPAPSCGPGSFPLLSQTYGRDILLNLHYFLPYSLVHRSCQGTWVLVKKLMVSTHPSHVPVAVSHSTVDGEHHSLQCSCYSTTPCGVAVSHSTTHQDVAVSLLQLLANSTVDGEHHYRLYAPLEKFGREKVLLLLFKNRSINVQFCSCFHSQLVLKPYTIPQPITTITLLVLHLT